MRALIIAMMLPMCAQAGALQQVDKYCSVEAEVAGHARGAYGAGVPEQAYCQQELKRYAKLEDVCQLINIGYNYNIADPASFVYARCVKSFARYEQSEEQKVSLSSR